MSFLVVGIKISKWKATYEDERRLEQMLKDRFELQRYSPNSDTDGSEIKILAPTVESPAFVSISDVEYGGTEVYLAWGMIMLGRERLSSSKVQTLLDLASKPGLTIPENYDEFLQKILPKPQHLEYGLYCCTMTHGSPIEFYRNSPPV